MSTDPSPAPAPPTAEPPLPSDLAVCHQMILELLASLRQRDRENEGLRHRLDLLLRRLYGPRAEKIDPHQLLLFPDALTPPEPAPAPAAETPPETPASPKKSNGHGRRQFPQNLPRVRQEHDLTPAEKGCPDCGQERRRIGAETSTQLDYQPASLFLVEHVRFTYACPHCQGAVATAAKPPQPIAKGLPGPGLLAQTVVDKYVDHLPLYRQERRHERQGLRLSRQTLCDWMAAAAERLTPVYQRLRVRVLQSRLLHSDDTPVPVLEDGRHSTRRGHLWVYVGDRRHPFTVYDYTPNRCRDGPLTFLADFAGYLQADAYAGYDGVFATGKVQELGCWAHARRKFYEARGSDSVRAHAALAWVRRLYDVEDAAAAAIAAAVSARGQPLTDDEADAVRLRLRQERAVPLLTSLCQWLEEQRREVVPKSPFGQACGYALNQWAALERYTTAGDLAIDNNVAERALRAVAIGRKNWLFAGSDRGGQTAAILYSVTASAVRHGHNPFVYLRELFTRLPSLSPPATCDHLDALLPDRWTLPTP